MKIVDIPRGVNWLIGTTFVGQGINFLVLPFWLHNFGTEQVVTYGFLMVLANLLSPIFTCKYENLIFTKDEIIGKFAAIVALRILVSTSIFFGILFYLIAFVSSAEMSGSICYAFVFTILTSIANIQFANCVSRGLRKRIEIYNWCRPLICAFASIAFMLAPASPVGLVQSQSIGIAISIVIIISQSSKNERISWNQYSGIVLKTWKSQLFFVIESLIHNLDSNLIFLFLTRTYPADSTAAYYTSEKIFAAYSQIRIESVRPIYLKKFRDVPLREALSDVLSPRNREVISNLILLFAMIPFAILYILQTSPTHLGLTLLIWIMVYQSTNSLLKVINMLLVSSYIAHEKPKFILFNTTMQLLGKIFFLSLGFFFSLSIISILILGTLQTCMLVGLTLLRTKSVAEISSRDC